MADKNTSGITDYQRRTGQDLPDQKVTKDTDLSPKGKDGEVFMETREADANIERIQKLVERVYWDDPSLPGDNDIDNDEEKRALEILALSKIVNGKMQVPCLWKEGEPDMKSSNYAFALTRLRSLFKQKTFNKEVYTSLDELFQQYLKDGIIEEVNIKGGSQMMRAYSTYMSHPLKIPKKITTLPITHLATISKL